MPLDLDTWKAKLKENLCGWKPRMQRLGVTSTYAMIATAALLPVYQACQHDGLLAVGLALGQFVGAVGGNLIANQIQGWKDRSVEDIVQEVESQAAGDAQLRAVLDQMLEQLDAVASASAALQPSERAWFEGTLRRELAQLGSRLSAPSIHVHDGAAAVGDNNIAVGKDGVHIGGSVEGDFVGPHGTLIKSLDPRQIADRVAAARHRYLHSLYKHCQSLPLAALGAEETAEAAVTLDRVYIELDTTTRIALTVDEQLKRDAYPTPFEDDKRTRPLSALEAAQSAPCLALLGEAGAGKSTFARKLLAWQAAACQGEAAPPQGFAADLLPVLIILRDLAPRLTGLDLANLPDRKARQKLIGIVRDQVRADLSQLDAEAFGDALWDAIRVERCFLVLDGLDEVPVALRPLIRQAVMALLAETQPLGETPQQRVLLTCRIRSYVGEAVLPGFQAYTLAKFDREKVTSFCSAWYHTQQALGRMNAGQAREKAADLARAALGSDLRELSSNPMMLTTMAIIHQKEIGLPRERVRLYNLAVDILLRRWQKHKTGEKEMSPSPALVEFLRDDLRLRSAVEMLAYESHRTEQGKQEAADLSRGDALALLEAPACLGNAGLAGEFLDYADQRAGLLVGRGGEPGRPSTYSFPHRTFQEYLAGCHMVAGRDIAHEYFARAAEGDHWSSAAQLGAEELLYNRRSKTALLDLAYRLNVAPSDPQHQRALVWSGQIAAVLGCEAVERDTDSPQGGQEYLKQLLPELVKLFGSNLGPVERAEAGRVLGILGDPRREVMAVDEMEFCYVPAGDYKIGGDPSDEPEAFRSETPQQEVSLPAFWIARYPVSNAQFAEFFMNHGYTTDHYWGEAAKLGQWKNGAVHRQVFVKIEGEYTYRTESTCGPRDYGRPYSLPNHPVVGICWYEAMAFSRWLLERWAGRLPQNWQVQLPSESEWEKAARGGLIVPSDPVICPIQVGFPPTMADISLKNNLFPGRAYPWGPDFDPQKANVYETGISTTSALGCFPNGASPNGVQDLSGNVGEWTRSRRAKSPYGPGDGHRDSKPPKDHPRVLRGGAFEFSLRHAGCACRNWLSAGSFESRYVGFRVVVSPPTSER